MKSKKVLMNYVLRRIHSSYYNYPDHDYDYRTYLVGIIKIGAVYTENLN